ncbi:hypothetical protein FE257_005619 [Aspergillus nanangensis]|uniref:Phosphoglycerate mutase-like protein n=1 Tax=Aspergillus nanangensis TaxID=2582783 RepID=A0AAD4CQB3_ASPNN|nr:hypothetical protein FE257_005619 [Aspergillus nanangensis]
MAPIIHLVRHAEGLHNLGQEFWSLMDPPLTDKGRHQCLQLQRDFVSHSRIDLVVSSPLCRAIYSAVQAFRPDKLTLLPDLQEISDFPCDIGREVESLKNELKDLEASVDYSYVDDLWTSKEGRYTPNIQAIQERARAVRCWLNTREEKEIVVVSHGAFLHFLTEDWEDSYIEEATGWKNAEYRTYNLQPKSCADDASMIETNESRQRRAKLEPRATSEEQLELHVKALHIWEQQGYLFSAKNRDSC